MPYFPSISQPGGVAPGESIAVVTCTIDFGHPDGGEQADSDVVYVVAPWVTEDTILSCFFLSVSSGSLIGSSLDHNAEDILVEGIKAYATNIVPGVGFDVQGYAPNNTWGRYTVHVIGQ